MDTQLKVLFVDPGTGFYRVERFPLGAFFGPVDLGLHLAFKHGASSFGTGLLAGSILPGSNRLVFTGMSPCWEGFTVSSMGGAGLVFDDLGIDLVSLVGRAARPSALVLNRRTGEEIEVRVEPVDVRSVWDSGRGGVFALLDHALERFGGDYAFDPRVLAVGPAAATTDFGAVASAPVKKGRTGFADTWAGRGGLGSRLLQSHGVAAVIYGGTHADEDFRDRTVADAWFEDRYAKKLAAKDFEATTKYRFDSKVGTGGTFGVNFASLGTRMLSFNYRSLSWDKEKRERIHRDFVAGHYLKQFNEETIAAKDQRTCGEPCAAVCKKLRGAYKKDYEPYQTLGPLSGVFDQRAAEHAVHRADQLGFDAIAAGGVVAWLLDCLDTGALAPADLAVEERPRFSPEGFDVVADSMHNARIAAALLDNLVARRGVLDASRGARRLARRLARERGRAVLDPFVYLAFGRGGWMVPNQYWTPGVLSPMAVMGKYYMVYADDFVPPRELGRRNAGRFVQELALDNLGICRFHRRWAEEMLEPVMESLFSLGPAYMANARNTAARIQSRNASLFWETPRCTEFVHAFLKRKRDEDGVSDPELAAWIGRFDAAPGEAARDFWTALHRGAHEALAEF